MREMLHAILISNFISATIAQGGLCGKLAMPKKFSRQCLIAADGVCSMSPTTMFGMTTTVSAMDKEIRTIAETIVWIAEERMRTNEYQNLNSAIHAVSLAVSLELIRGWMASNKAAIKNA